MQSIERRIQILEKDLRRTKLFNRVLAFAAIAMLAIGISRAEDVPVTAAEPQVNSSKRDLNEPDLNQKGSAKSGTAEPSSVVPVRRSGSERLHTIEAEQIVLVDRFGKQRITLDANELDSGHGPGIRFFDQQGHKRVELSQAPANSGLLLFAANDRVVARLQATNDGDGASFEVSNSKGRAETKPQGFIVRDRHRQVRSQLSLVNGNFPLIGLSQRDQNGPTSVEITASDSGQRAIKIHNAQGQPLASIVGTKSGESFLNMGNPSDDRDLRISTGSRQADGPVVAFFATANRDGSGGHLPWLKFGMRRDHEPFIRILDGDGKPRFTAPNP